MYIKGPIPVELPTTIIMPNSSITATVGIAHHNFCFQRYFIKSPAILSLNNKFFILKYTNYVLSITNLPITKVSIPLFKNVLIASWGAVTIGSPLTLNDVFNNIGTPVIL